jgi:hypothetical protein
LQNKSKGSRAADVWPCGCPVLPAALLFSPSPSFSAFLSLSLSNFLSFFSSLFFSLTEHILPFLKSLVVVFAALALQQASELQSNFVVEAAAVVVVVLPHPRSEPLSCLLAGRLGHQSMRPVLGGLNDSREGPLHVLLLLRAAEGEA